MSITHHNIVRNYNKHLILLASFVVLFCWMYVVIASRSLSMRVKILEAQSGFSIIFHNFFSASQHSNVIKLMYRKAWFSLIMIKSGVLCGKFNNTCKHIISTDTYLLIIL